MLKLNVGTNRKIGQPDYGSAGASCNLEIELDAALFQDLDGLHHVVRRAYAACNQAVTDELARLANAGPHGQHAIPANAEPGPVPTLSDAGSTPVTRNSRATDFTSNSDPHTPHTRHAQLGTGRPSPRPATTSQVKAIRAICSRRKIDLLALLRDRFGIQTADELGIRQASDLIDELKSDEGSSHPGTNGHANGNGSGTYAVNGGAR
jgi:hypothetical protein